MAEPLPIPIRILVKSSSTTVWTSWMGGPRSDMVFPRAIEANLHAEGRPVELRNTGVLASPTQEFIRTYERDVVQFSPDVVIITAGHYEVLHLFLPRRYERYSNRPNVRGTKRAVFWRRRVVRPVWKAAAIVQSKVDSLPDRFRLRKRRLHRAADDLRAYLKQLQMVQSPLVFVLELLPVAPNRVHWFPGMNARIEYWNALAEKVIEEFDSDNIRFFRTRALAYQLVGDDLDKAVPDGYHYTPELHALIGAEFAREISKWAESQPHLTVDP